MNHEIIIDKWRDRSRASRDMAELSIDLQQNSVELDDPIDIEALDRSTASEPFDITDSHPCRDCPEGMEW